MRLVRWWTQNVLNYAFTMILSLILIHYVHRLHAVTWLKKKKIVLLQGIRAHVLGSSAAVSLVIPISRSCHRTITARCEALESVESTPHLDCGSLVLVVVGQLVFIFYASRCSRLLLPPLSAPCDPRVIASNSHTRHQHRPPTTGLDSHKQLNYFSQIGHSDQISASIFVKLAKIRNFRFAKSLWNSPMARRREQ